MKRKKCNMIYQNYETKCNKFALAKNNKNEMEGKMDGLKNDMDGVEAKMDGMEAKIDGIEGKIEDLKKDMEGLKEGLEKLLQEKLPNGEKSSRGNS